MGRAWPPTKPRLCAELPPASAELEIHAQRGQDAQGALLSSGEVNPSSMAPGNAYGHCKDNGNGHPNQQPAGCDTGVLAFEYDYDERGLIEARDITTDETVTATGYVHDALGRLTESTTGEYTATYGWDAASNLVFESVSEDLTTPKKNDGYTATRTVNEVNQLTRVVTDPDALPASHTTTDLFVYDGRGNRVVETQVRGTGSSAKVASVVSYVFDGMDQVVGVTDWGKSLTKSADDTVTVFERDGLGRALTVTEDGASRERLFDGYQLVADGGTQLVRDPFGGVLAELDQVVEGNGRWATMVTRQQEVLTDVLGSTVTVATDGVIDADLRLFGDFGEVLTEPDWDTVTGFTGKVDTAGLTEFVTRSFDVGARVWVPDDVYRGEVTRASSMNRYAYVEGAPETYVDVLGFFRAAAALEAQRLAAAEAAWLSAVESWKQSQPLCGGYYGCYRSKTYEQQYADASYSWARSNWNEQTIQHHKDYAKKQIELRWINEQHAIEQDQIRTELHDPSMLVYNVGMSVAGFGRGLWDTGWDIGKFALEQNVFTQTYKMSECFVDFSSCMDDKAQQRDEVFDVLKDLGGRWVTGQALSSGLLTGDASIGDVWDNAFSLGNDYVWGGMVDSYRAGDYFGGGQQLGRITAEVALLVTPVKALPKVPKIPANVLANAERNAATANAFVTGARDARTVLAAERNAATANAFVAGTQQARAVTAATAANTLPGSGPVPGVLEASDRVSSFAALRNYSSKGVEYVFAPESGTFAVGRPAASTGLMGSPHQQLARSIGANPSTVVGGTLTRTKGGPFVITENSGHYWQNWTPGVRQQFVDTMRSYGFDVTY